MYKVLIVEDMDITREDIMALIKWQDYGFELLPDARNGKIGLEYARRYHPDIVITDIKMPIMTGLEMITEIKKWDHHTKFILLTAYEEFELAKQALEMGIQSFILKYEIEDTILLAELNKLVELIRKEKNIETMTIRHSLEKLLTDKNRDTYIEEEYFQWIGRSVFLDIKRLQFRTEIGDENFEDILQNELAQYRFILLKLSAGEYVIFLKVPESHSELERNTYVRQFITALQSIYLKILHTETAVAIGGYIKCNRDIVTCRKRALESLSLHIFYKGNCIIESNEKHPTKISEETVQKKTKAFHEKINREDYLTAKEILSGLFREDLAKSRDIPLFKKTTIRLIYYFREKGYEIESAEFDDYLEKIRTNLLDDNIYTTLERFLYLTDVLEEYANNQYSRKIRTAMTYIRTHYAENPGLNDIAEILDVTPIYLSHLFKKETGLTFSAYITKIRIENAKRLLKQGDKRISEISELVGYQTVQYFSRVFKRETGKTPKEYE